MPIYDLQCERCKKVVEVIVSRPEDRPTHCQCGGPFFMLYSPPNVVFKGKGFYSTDNRR